MSSRERIGERWWSETDFYETELIKPYLTKKIMYKRTESLHKFKTYIVLHYFSSSLNRVLLLIWRSKDKATVTDDFTKNLHLLFLDFDVTDKIGVPFYILFFGPRA